MPIPNPKKNENKYDYIKRIMDFFKKDNTLHDKKIDLENEADRKQILAIAYSKFKEYNKNENIDILISKINHLLGEVTTTSDISDAKYIVNKKKKKKKCKKF